MTIASASSTGDLARIFQARRMTTGIKQDLARLGQELTTGIRQDIGTAVSGDFSPIARIEHTLATLQARKVVTDEAGFAASAMQVALETVQNSGRTTSQGLLSLQGNAGEANRTAAAQNARDHLETVIAALNTNVGGRSLFAGAATDRAALIDPATLMADLTAAVSGATTAADVVAGVDAWFDTPGGGFETTAYLGADEPMGAFQIAEGRSVSLDVRADDPALREMLKGLALAALVSEGVLAGNSIGQTTLLTTAGERLIAADHDLTALRADIGVVEEEIENVAVSNEARMTSLKISRNDLVGVDPYETASEMEAAYNQLETYYTVTARLARLKFTDYL